MDPEKKYNVGGPTPSQYHGIHAKPLSRTPQPKVDKEKAAVGETGIVQKKGVGESSRPIKKSLISAAGDRLSKYANNLRNFASHTAGKVSSKSALPSKKETPFKQVKKSLISAAGDQLSKYADATKDRLSRYAENIRNFASSVSSKGADRAVDPDPAFSKSVGKIEAMNKEELTTKFDQLLVALGEVEQRNKEGGFHLESVLVMQGVDPDYTRSSTDSMYNINRTYENAITLVSQFAKIGGDPEKLSIALKFFESEKQQAFIENQLNENYADFVNNTIQSIKNETPRPPKIELERRAEPERKIAPKTKKDKIKSKGEVSSENEIKDKRVFYKITENPTDNFTNLLKIMKEATDIKGNLVVSKHLMNAEPLGGSLYNRNVTYKNAINIVLEFSKIANSPDDIKNIKKALEFFEANDQDMKQHIETKVYDDIQIIIEDIKQNINS